MISRAGPKEEPTPMFLVDTNVISEARKGSRANGCLSLVQMEQAWGENGLK
jgi:hypothetical protein